jgi:hypothetical protein
MLAITATLSSSSLERNYALLASASPRARVPGLSPESGGWLTPPWRGPSYRRVLDRITARLAVLVCVGHAGKGQLLGEEETRKRHLVNGPLGSLHDPDQTLTGRSFLCLGAPHNDDKFGLTVSDAGE